VLTGRLFHALTIRSEKKEDLVEQHECRLYSLYGCPRVMPAGRVSKKSTEQIFYTVHRYPQQTDVHRARCVARAIAGETGSLDHAIMREVHQNSIVSRLVSGITSRNLFDVLEFSRAVQFWHLPIIASAAVFMVLSSCAAESHCESLLG